MSDVPDAGSPLAEAAARSVQVTVEVGVAVAVAAQAVVRAARERADARAAGDNEVAAHHHAHLRRAAAASWAPALEDRWPAEAGAGEAFEAWSAAQAWLDDPEAAQAARRAERRLAELHPDLMRSYRDARAAGLAPGEAMWEAGKATCAPAWAPALDPDALARMGPEEALASWNAARPWAGGDPGAAHAMAAAEGRLRRIRPVAMAAYDDHRAAGAGPADAMAAVLADLRVRDGSPVATAALGPGSGVPADPSFPLPLDLGGAEAGRVVAVAERATAARALHTPDDRRTGHDEAAVAAASGADHLEYAEASAARAAALAGRCYPQPLAGAASPRLPAAPAIPRGWTPAPGRRR